MNDVKILIDINRLSYNLFIIVKTPLAVNVIG